MFRGGPPNAYDEIVAKTTDENLTSENWELILNLCDKVQEEGEQGARNVIASVLKRLAHRNPNVQLYALALVEALSKNCGSQVHHEIASRSFTQGLEKLITDRTTHDKVKRKALSLILMWTQDFANDPTLGIMEECYEALKAKNYKFEEKSEPPPPQVDDEIRRREEEELQRVLEMSVLDKGGRAAWDSFGGGSYNGDSNGAGPGPSSSKQPAGPSRAPMTAAPEPAAAYAKSDFGYAKAASGYVPARTPSPKVQSPAVAVPTPAVNPVATTAGTPAYTGTSSQTSLPLTSVTRVRALHSFEATEQGELTFEKGDVIKVVDRNYKDWWRGQLKGRTGIFPVNYVELLPDPTPEDIAREAEQEAAIFAQAANIDKLLSMLRGLDPARDNLADNEEIQELYRSSMALRPKIVKLIDKYSQKKSELVSMNDTFVKARVIFDRMMEESLARHSGLYEGRPAYQPVQPQFRPDSRARPDYRSNMYVSGGYEQTGFAGFPQPKPAYSAGTPAPGTQPYAEQIPAYSAPPPQQPQYAQPVQPAPPGGGQYGPAYMDPNAAYNASAYGQAAPTQSQPPVQPQVQPTPQLQAQPQVQPQPQAQAQSQPPPQQNGYQDPAAGAPTQAQPQQAQHQQAQPQAQTITQGPPYVFDPNANYPDPNAQAWAQYYAQGGTDLTGAVYFISIPGLTDKQPPAAAQPQAQPQPQSQPQQQHITQAISEAQPTSGSPENVYQAYPVQQNQTVGDGAPGYVAQQQPHNGSVTSVHAPQYQPNAAPEYTAQNGGSPQHTVNPQQPQGPGSSPTLSHNTSYFGVPAQPASPGGSTQHPPTQQTYPPNPYGAAPDGQAPQPAYSAQYAQMHGQFAAIGMGEPRSPTGPAPAAQTA